MQDAGRPSWPEVEVCHVLTTLLYLCSMGDFPTTCAGLPALYLTILEECFEAWMAYLSLVWLLTQLLANDLPLLPIL